MAVANSQSARPATASSEQREGVERLVSSVHRSQAKSENGGSERRSLDRVADVRVLLSSSSGSTSPEALQNLSVLSKNLAKFDRLKKRTKSSVEAQEEGKVLGYNPLLRKYELPMPPSVARYLARGRDVLIDSSARRTALTSDFGHVLDPPSPHRKPTSKRSTPRPYQKEVASARILLLSKPNKRRSLEIDLSRHERPYSSRSVETRDIVQANKTNLDLFTPRNHIQNLHRQAEEHQQKVEETYARAQALKREQWDKAIQSFIRKHSKSSTKPQETELHNRIEMEQKKWLTLVVLANFTENCSELLIREHQMRERRFGQIVNVRRNVQKIARLFRIRRSENYEQKLHNQKHNAIFSIIRWCFENRMAVSQDKKFYRCIANYVLRHHYRMYCSLWNKPGTIIKHLLLQLRHQRSVLQSIRVFKEKVIYCQRMFRNSIIRSQLRIDYVQRRFKEHFYVLILKAMNKSLSVLFPTSVIADIKFIGNAEANKLFHGQQRSNYHRMFPKVPLWIAASLEKICNEFVRLCRDVHSVNVRHSEAWKIVQDLFCFFQLPEAVHTLLAGQVYNELQSHARSKWSQFLRDMRMATMKDAQEQYVQEDWDSRALTMYTTMRADQSRAKKARKPLWPMELLTEVKVAQKFQEWLEALIQNELASRAEATGSSRGWTAVENTKSLMQLANSDSLIGWILFLIRSVEESPGASPRGSFRRTSIASLQNEMFRRGSTDSRSKTGMYKKITLEKIVRDKMGRSALNTVARQNK
eukprot:760584-Hanusia_phi.AAC.2